MQSLQSTVTLNNGVAMPIFGLGVYNSKEETTFAVSTAIRHGYRLIDTAAFYENEKEVGEGIKDSGIPRDDLFITSVHIGFFCASDAVSNIDLIQTFL